MEEKPPPYFHPNMQLWLAIAYMAVILIICGLVAVFGENDSSRFRGAEDVAEVFPFNSADGGVEDRFSSKQ